jgi:hypothetical protein
MEYALALSTNSHARVRIEERFTREDDALPDEFGCAGWPDPEWPEPGSGIIRLPRRRPGRPRKAAGGGDAKIAG